MDVGAIAADAPPTGRKQHKPTSSLGSLYEVLADLDESQLEYLLQEMNHTGHQNVKVSQAVSAFDSQSPPVSLNATRTSVLPAEPGLQRQLSKSQQGKLRLQTVFQRTPSLRQRGADQQMANKPARDTKSGTVRNPPIQASSPHESSPLRRGVDDLPSHEQVIQLPKRGSVASTASHRPPPIGRTTSTAYKSIPRPDFSLPPGITVSDLLQLLEAEFLSLNSGDAQSPISLASPAGAIPRQRSSSPFLLSPSSSTSISASPASSGGRTLRRHSSRLDMALDAERNASGFEEIGLGLLEPRARATSSAGASAPVTPIDPFARGFGSDTPPNVSPVVMEGIFDVLENR